MDLVKNDPSNKYFNKQCRLGEHLIFRAYAGQVEGVINKVRKYELKLAGQKELLQKHDILYLYKPNVCNSVVRSVKTNNKIAEKQLHATFEKDERLDISYDILERCYKQKRLIDITLRNGHILQGRIHSFGMYSIRLEIGSNSRVIIMLANVYDLNYGDVKRSQAKAKKKVMTPIPGKMDVTIKISEIPSDVEILKNQWRKFIVKTEQYNILLKVRPKTWNKLKDASDKYSLWIAVINGKMGRFKDGAFELDQPGLQVFERGLRNCKAVTL